MNRIFYEQLIQVIPKELVACNESMKKHTTFQVGGCACYFIRIKNVTILLQVLDLVNKYEISYFIVGNGSNLLVSETGYQGAILQLQADEASIQIRRTRITVGAGNLLSAVANLALANSLSGMEFLAGIPGTIGGAVYMNAGAYGGEIKDIVISAKILNKHGKIITLTKEELVFDYRTSVLKNVSAILLEVTLELREGNVEIIQDTMKDFMNRRKEKQPLSFPSAGSTFKRPKDNFAGKLIMDSGLSGYRIGGVCVSTKHCGFIINDLQGTATDVYQLMQYVVRKVKEQQGIILEPEIIMLGEFK